MGPPHAPFQRPGGQGGSLLYFNLHDGEKWAAAVLGGECRADEWTHAAVIVQRINEPPQGRAGYQARLFLNGEMVAGREVLNLTGAATEADAPIGRGWGGPHPATAFSPSGRLAAYARRQAEGGPT